MILFTLYASIGGLFFLAVIIKQTFIEKKSALFSLDQQIPRFTIKWFWKRSLLPTLGIFLLISLWPIWVYLLYKEWLSDKRHKQHELDSEFRVLKNHLVRELTVTEVELLEQIIDPLAATPDLPFGHLNSAWQNFVIKRPDNAQLWSFENQLTDYFGKTYSRAGYVWVSAKGAFPWFIKRELRLESREE